MFWYRLKKFFSLTVSIPVWVLLLIAIVGLGVAGAVWLFGSERHPWLEVRKDNEGKMAGLRIDPRKIPRKVLAELLPPGETVPLSDPSQIKALAEHYGLYQSWESNPHLCFNDGVVDYWSKQRRPAWELELQFLSRRLVLEAAEHDHARIPYPGDLSKWAERVYPVLLKKAQEK